MFEGSALSVNDFDFNTRFIIRFIQWKIPAMMTIDSEMNYCVLTV